MQKFKSTGLWFIPSNPEDRVVGTLENKGQLQLSLTGSFGGFAFDPSIGERQPLILGVVEESPSGRFVSLYNSRHSSHTFRMPGFATDRWTPEMAIIGESFLDELAP